MRPRFQQPERPRRVIATFNRYGEAERAVDYLSDHGFPVERSTIVGRDLEYVEQVTGRMTYARAALDGLWFGALVGAVMGLVTHALSRGRRDFSAIGGMRANHYEVAVEESVADEAARLLGELMPSGDPMVVAPP